MLFGDGNMPAGNKKPKRLTAWVSRPIVSAIMRRGNFFVAFAHISHIA